MARRNLPAEMAALPLAKRVAPQDQATAAVTIAESVRTGEPVYPLGGQTSLDYGLPPSRLGIGIDLTALNHVVDYVPRDMTITVGDDPDDEGQAAMVAAEATTFDYNCRVTLNDAKTPGGSGSVHYFKAKIMSKQLQVGTATDVVKRNFSAAINSAITSVDPT